MSKEIQITKEQFLAITSKNEVKITFGSAFSSVKDYEAILLPSSKPRYSKKYSLHKLTFTNKNNLNGAKFYAYLRGDKVSFAHSDCPIMIKTFQVD